MLCILSCVGNSDASAESREVCLLKQRANSVSVLQSLRQNRSSRRKTKAVRGERLCRLPSKIALKEQMFVPFAEASKSVLPVASEPARTKNVKTSTARLSSENKTSGFSPVVNVHYNAVVDQIVAAH